MAATLEPKFTVKFVGFLVKSQVHTTNGLGHLIHYFGYNWTETVY